VGSFFSSLSAGENVRPFGGSFFFCMLEKDFFFSPLEKKKFPQKHTSFSSLPRAREQQQEHENKNRHTRLRAPEVSSSSSSFLSLSLSLSFLPFFCVERER
jgi:hypothetical protein